MNTHSPLSKNGDQGSNILCINFNQDQGCFAVGHENGFLVYNSNPIDLRVKRNFNTHHHARSNSHYSSSSSTTSHGVPASSPSNGSGPGCGIGHITMLHRTNYLALVGGGKKPKFANNKVIIWDDLKRKNSLSLEFMSPVYNVLLSRTRIIVVLKNQVLVYGFSAPPKKFATYETIDNDHGLADLSVNSSNMSSSSVPSSSSSASNGYTNGSSSSFPSRLAKDSGSSASIASASALTAAPSASGTSLTPSVSAALHHKEHNTKFQVLAFPGRSVGQIQLVDVSLAGQEKNLVSIIKAHKSKIRCLALNRSGTLIASASETGTIIRIHSTYNTALLYEFRRGLDRAVITSMKFSHNDTKLAVLSDKNTLHIYNVSSLNNNHHQANTSANSTGNHDTESISSLSSTSSSWSSSRSNGHANPVNRQHLLKKLAIPIPIPMPNYFNSTWSFCSLNTNQYHTNNGSSKDGNNNDVGVLGWTGNDSVIIIWKEKRIWEKYVIVDKSRNTTNGGSPGPGDGSSASSRPNGGWEIIRYSWKSLDNLN